MTRTPIARLLQRIHAAHREAAARAVPVDDVVDDRCVARTTRGRFLAGLGAVAAASALPEPARSALRFAQAPRVVIVGGGAAGVTCAYRLWQAGVTSTLFEANRSVGGRTWTLRNYFDDGQIAEHGGEFISSDHLAVRRLAAELGLTLVNVNKAQPPGAVDTYFFNGARYTVRDSLRDYAAVFDPMHDSLQAAGYPTFYNRNTMAGHRLDHMSVLDWIERFVPGGASSSIGKLLATSCLSEYGLDVDVQSALNLVYLLGFEKRGRLNLSGTDEAFHTVGGNDQYVTMMASRLPSGTIRTDCALVALRRNSGGSYTCTFGDAFSSRDVAADHVILALPFTLLREVDFSRAGFDARKTRAIDELGMGTNAKLHLQFTNRLWEQEGYSGTAYGDAGLQTVWEVSRAQPGASGIIVDFPGGSGGASFHAPAHAPASAEVSRRFLAELEPVFPGVTNAWNGKAFLDFWAADRWHRGSYSCYLKGQYTGFSGYERVRQGNVHFCGEHTSIAFQGYINGAVHTGENAAAEVLSDLGFRSATVAASI